MGSIGNDQTVFVFLGGMPQRQGSGANLRFYSNVRAYLDLGFKVELIQIDDQDVGSAPSHELSPIKWTKVIEQPGDASLPGRAMFRLGLPTGEAVSYLFPLHQVVKREFALRYRNSPTAIFHFDGESLANVIPWLPRSARAVWSIHDLPSVASLATIKIACEADKREPSAPERRHYRFAQRTERLMARKSTLVLCIGNHDAVRLKTEWRCAHAEYLPMSIPDDGFEPETRERKPDAPLSLLHLGRISHLPSYRSMEFLLEQVFPKLPPALLGRILLNVVGRVDNDDRSRRIQALAEKFPNVSFHGFVDDVIPYYNENDAQIVASTDAVGLRTRIVESFAYGLPVISTSVAAEGIGGFMPGRHLLIADTADDFARQLRGVLAHPETLDRLSQQGRKFYLENQSRKAVAASLSHALEKHLGIRTPGYDWRNDLVRVS